MIDKLEYCGEIRDPIHGLIRVTEIEFEVMDTPEFQRLRRIKQLALADLGFHGAVHNRFGHSVGVMHVASKMAEHLMNPRLIRLSKQELQDIRLAALLHDIGHGPFSHISEYLLKHFSSESANKENIEEIHEAISHRIIADSKSLRKTLGNPRIERILNILSTEQPNPDFKHDLVSGPLDADKMDYLLRDSYFTGVKYGVFDLDRLINVLTITVENKQKRLAAKREGVQTVEQYVLAKYFIAHQVYQHRIRHITDKMIIEGVIAAVKEGNRELRKLYDYRSTSDYITQYLKWDDESVFESILRNKKPSSTASSYFKMLRNRQLLTELANCRLDELGGNANLEAIKRFGRIKQGDCADLVKELSTKIGLKAGFTYILVYSLKVPLIQRSFGVVDEDSILIKLTDKTTTTLENESQLYTGIQGEAKNQYIQVIGLPKRTESNKGKREKRINTILTRYFKGK